VRPRCSPISLAFCRHEHIGRSFGWSWQPQNSTSSNMRDTDTLTCGLIDFLFSTNLSDVPVPKLVQRAILAGTSESV